MAYFSSSVVRHSSGNKSFSSLVGGLPAAPLIGVNNLILCVRARNLQF